MSLVDTFKKLLGIAQIETRLNSIERKSKEVEQKIRDLGKLHSTSIEKIKKREQNILKVLNGKMTTQQIADALKTSRSRTSIVLNKLERQGNVKEVVKKGREVLYERV